MTYLSSQPEYEDNYDRLTVEAARRHIVYYDNFYSEFKKKLPKGDKIDRPGNALLLNVFYMQTVGNELLQRYENRSSTINEWIARDKAKDEQIAAARLAEEPYCHHCNKTGLRIINKSLMHRGENYKLDNPGEVLFMLKCPHCDKNSIFWEDGTTWKPKPTLCPKCNAEMTHTTVKAKKVLNFTYSCPSCQHTYKDKLDLTDKKDDPDPDYDKARIHYCLLDKEFRDNLFEIKRGIERMAELGKEFKEKEDNKQLYDALAKLKRLKIPELTPLLAPALQKAGYTEFSLDKPAMGREVTVDFNCLDSKSEREDYNSRSTLKKLVEKTLIGTNWRLMSDGIHYRLGYLNGRLRVYENEEDLLKLIEKTLKPKTKRTDN